MLVLEKGSKATYLLNIAVLYSAILHISIFILSEFYMLSMSYVVIVYSFAGIQKRQTIRKGKLPFFNIHIGIPGSFKIFNLNNNIECFRLKIYFASYFQPKGLYIFRVKSSRSRPDIVMLIFSPRLENI